MKQQKQIEFERPQPPPPTKRYTILVVETDELDGYEDGEYLEITADCWFRATEEDLNKALEACR